MKSVADVELFPEVGDVKRGRGDKNEVAISWSSCSLFPGVSRSTGVVVGILAWFSKEKDQLNYVNRRARRDGRDAMRALSRGI